MSTFTMSDFSRALQPNSNTGQGPWSGRPPHRTRGCRSRRQTLRHRSYPRPSTGPDDSGAMAGGFRQRAAWSMQPHSPFGSESAHSNPPLSARSPRRTWDPCNRRPPARRWLTHLAASLLSAAKNRGARSRPFIHTHVTTLHGDPPKIGEHFPGPYSKPHCAVYRPSQICPRWNNGQ
jgi:hypothetical protein